MPDIKLEALEAQLKQLEQEHQVTIANALRLEGAIQWVKHQVSLASKSDDPNP